MLGHDVAIDLRVGPLHGVHLSRHLRGHGTGVWDAAAPLPLKEFHLLLKDASLLPVALLLHAAPVHVFLIASGMGEDTKQHYSNNMCLKQNSMEDTDAIYYLVATAMALTVAKGVAKDVLYFIA